MIETGTVISGRYEVLEKIGTGGMSDVYKAKDNSLGREVALKVLKEEFVTDMGFVTKFRAEATAAAGLEHPNIVNIYDVGNEAGRYYIVMEYVEGVTLKTYIAKKGQLSQNELLSIAIQVGRGIEAAHNKNIIHRDIKPQNIIISKEGKVKVTDFGIARAVTGNTINADRMGSVHYSSPEQARNGFVTYQSDIYSLGIVMYEMCTGHVPFDGDTTVSIAIQHLQSEITPPSVFVPDVPISVEKIILKATMKNPERRYLNITDMLADLKRALTNPDEDFVVIAPANRVTGAIPSEEEIVAAVAAGEAESNVSHSSDASEKSGHMEKEFYTIGGGTGKRRRTIDDIDDDDDDDEGGLVTRRMDKVVTVLGVAAAIVIIIIVIYLLGSFFGWFKFSGVGRDPEQIPVTSSSETTTNLPEGATEAEVMPVPGVLGKSELEAKAEIELAGFVYRKIGESSSDEYEAGTVMEQSVHEGTEAEVGTTIDIIVSNGSGDLPIPSVTGMTQDDALKLITAQGFLSSVQPEYNADVEQGRVIRQSPDAQAKGKTGDVVTIYVSRGKEVVRVPSVTGMTKEEAQSSLEAEGFVVEFAEEHSDNAPAGQVINQNPKGQAEKNSTVTVTVSLGPNEKFYKYSLTVSPFAGTEPLYVVIKADDGTILAQQVVTSTITMNLSNLPVDRGTVFYYSNEDRTTELVPRDIVTFQEQ